jgi:hypothetical protein
MEANEGKRNPLKQGRHVQPNTVWTLPLQQAAILRWWQWTQVQLRMQRKWAD